MDTDTSIVPAETLRIRCGGREWSHDQYADAERLLVEVEDEISNLLGAPISPLAARVETAPILTTGLVCPRWPVHSVTAVGDTVVDDDHPLDTVWLLEHGYLTHTDPDTLPTEWTTAGPVAGHGHTIGTVRLGYQPGWGAVASIRSMILKVALARYLNVHDDTMVARDLVAETPPPVREPTGEEIRARLGPWRWLQVWR